MITIFELVSEISLPIIFVVYSSSQRLIEVSLIRETLSSELALWTFGKRLFLIIFNWLISNLINFEFSISLIETRSLRHIIVLIALHEVIWSISVMNHEWNRISLWWCSHPLGWNVTSKCSLRSSWINWCSSEKGFWRISWIRQSVILLSLLKIRIIWCIFLTFLILIKMLMRVMIFGILIFFWRSWSRLLFLIMMHFLFQALWIFIHFSFFTK